MVNPVLRDTGNNKWNFHYKKTFRSNFYIDKQHFNKPSRLRHAYQVPEVPVGANGRTKVAVLTCFEHPPALVNNDVRVYCETFDIPTVQVTVINAPDVINFSPQFYSETIMDVQAVIAMNPNADIYVICQKFNGSTLTADVLQKAIDLGCTIITISYGVGEFPPPKGWDWAYIDNVTRANPEIIVCAAAGNDRFPGYPGTADNVYCIGGTRLYVDANNTIFETTEPKSACGEMYYTEQPEYQKKIPMLVQDFKMTKKCAPDFSINCIYFPMYISTKKPDGTTIGWGAAGGTSLSSPLMAGLFSLIDQFNLNKGLGNLKNSQIHEVLNRVDVMDFFIDITKGISNRDFDSATNKARFEAKVGYDVPTGFGCLKVSKWIDYFDNKTNYPPNASKLVWESQVCTPQKLKSVYNLPTVPVSNGKKRVKVGIVSAFYNTGIQKDFDRWCDEFDLPRKLIRVVHKSNFVPNFPALAGASNQLSVSLQSIYAVNPNAEIVIVCASSTETNPYAAAIEDACKMGCDIIKINYAFADTQYNGKNEDLSRNFDRVFAKYPNILFVCETGNTRISQPSTSRHVLCVGSTKIEFDNNGNSLGEKCALEQGWGMTSNSTPKPEYQKSIALLSSFKNKVVPELAAVGENGFPTYDMGKWKIISGTRLGASIVVGMFSLVNQARLNNNRPALRLAHLYGIFSRSDVSQYFYDIRNGQTIERLGQNIATAGPGYDLATGFGVPNVTSLINLVATMSF